MINHFTRPHSQIRSCGTGCSRWPTGPGWSARSAPLKTQAGPWFERVRPRDFPGLPAAGRFQRNSQMLPAVGRFQSCAQDAATMEPPGGGDRIVCSGLRDALGGVVISDGERASLI
jgi:hypothetical protein